MVMYSITYNHKFYFDFRKDFGVRSSPRWLAADAANAVDPFVVNTSKRLPLIIDFSFLDYCMSKLV